MAHPAQTDVWALNPPLLPPPFECAVFGFRVAEPPDLLAPLLQSGYHEAAAISVIGQRWAHMLEQLQRWQQAAFVLRFQIDPRNQVVETRLLVRLLTRPGSAGLISERLARQIVEQFALLELQLDRLASEDQLRAALVPFQPAALIEIRQPEDALSLQALDQPFYMVTPFQQPVGTWLPPFAAAMRQTQLSVISIHLEPCRLLPAERERFAEKAALGAQLEAGRIAGTIYSSGRVAADPVAGYAGRVFARFARLGAPFLLTVQVASPSEATAQAVAQEVAGALAASVAPAPDADLTLRPDILACPARDSPERRAAWRTFSTLCLADWGRTPPVDQRRLRYLIDAAGAAAAFRLPVSPPQVTQAIAGLNAQIIARRERAARPKATDLVLTLRFVGQNDQVQIIWESDVIGRYTSAFQSPYPAPALALVTRALDAIQHPQYPHTPPQFSDDECAQLAQLGLWSGTRIVADAQRHVGRAIYAALVADPNGAIALNNVRNHAVTQGQAVTYLLRLPPELPLLAALPWEALEDDRGPLLLSRGKIASCVRYLDLDQALPPLSPPGQTLRILAIAPQAGLSPEIRAAERDARNSAWGELIRAGVVHMDELEQTTPGGLFEALQSGLPVDIVHFYGHGRFRNGEGALLFDAPNSAQTWLPARRFAAVLGDTRLVMLHACKSAATDSDDMFAATAPALAAAGVPAVVAMQFTFRVAAATRFAGIVCQNLADGQSLQHAVNQARQALYVEEDDGVSWYVPTLTIRGRDSGPLHFVQR